MKTIPRFLLAKYVPDMKRMEPRNIGVFLWAKGRVRSRFLERPEFVNEPDAYKRWTSHWEAETSGDAIAPLRGKPVPMSDPACMDALLTSQKGNYILVDAGELLEELRVRDVDTAVDFLFNQLVAPSPSSEVAAAERQDSFANACRDVLDKAGIRDLEGFTRKYELHCPVYGVNKHLRFSYGVGNNGHPDALYQKVSIDSDVSVHDAAFKLRAVIEHAIVDSRERCAVMIQASQIALSDNGAADNRKLLENICPVIDVENDLAVEKLRATIRTKVKAG